MSEAQPTWDPDVAAYLAGALGSLGGATFGRISSACSCPPRHTCVRVNTLSTTAQDVLQHIVAHNPVSGTAPPFVHPLVPFAVMMPAEGPLTMDLSATDGWVLISRKAGEAVLRGAPVYVPGVLATSAGVKQGDRVVVCAAVELPHNGGKSCGVTRGTLLPTHGWDLTGAHPSTQGTGQLPQSYTQVCVGMGLAAMSRVEMFKQERGLAISMDQPIFRVPSVQGLEGRVMLQNLPSLVAAMALNPLPGQRVLDMCAAPGGKSTLIAQLMGNRGEVIALDRSQVKAQQVMKLAVELGVTCIKAYRMDATKALLSYPTAVLGATHPHAATVSRAEVSSSGGAAAVAARVTRDRVAERPDNGEFVSRQESEGEATEQQAVGDHGAQAGRQKVAARLQRKTAARAARGLPVAHAPGRTLVSAPHPTVVQGINFSTHQATQCSTPHATPHLTFTQQATVLGAKRPAPCAVSADQRYDHLEQHTGPHHDSVSGTVLPLAQELKGLKQGQWQGLEQDLEQGQGQGLDHERGQQQGPQQEQGQRQDQPLGFEHESFDCVLLDAPCSALGLRPRLHQSATMEYLRQSGQYNRKLLDVAVRLVRPGGRLVFSTCTISPWENEASVRWVLDRFGPNVLRLVAAEPRVGGPGLTGSHPQPVAAWGTHKQTAVADNAACSTCPEMQQTAVPSGHAEVWLTVDEAALVQRFDPMGKQDTIGFFIAAFLKVDSCKGI